MADRDQLKKLLDRQTDSNQILNSHNRIEKDTVENWNDFFNNVFEDPIKHPTHTKVLLRRHLPAEHLLNFTGTDLQIPFMFSFDDEDQQRWLGYIYDATPQNGGWKFLLMKPNKDVLLSYLAGKTPLDAVYDSAQGNIYTCQPDISRHLVRVNLSDLPESALPAEDSFYDENLWFDPNDIYFGMNMEDTRPIADLATAGLFYNPTEDGHASTSSDDEGDFDGFETVK